jgi:hypothetical protein
VAELEISTTGTAIRKKKFIPPLAKSTTPKIIARYIKGSMIDLGI